MNTAFDVLRRAGVFSYSKTWHRCSDPLEIRDGDFDIASSNRRVRTCCLSWTQSDRRGRPSWVPTQAGIAPCSSLPPIPKELRHSSFKTVAHDLPTKRLSVGLGHRGRVGDYRSRPRELGYGYRTFRTCSDLVNDDRP